MARIDLRLAELLQWPVDHAEGLQILKYEVGGEYRPHFDYFPQYRLAQVIDYEIGPGDLLFLPVGWWHYVKGLSISMTLTFTNFVFDNDFSSSYTTFQEL